MTIRRTKDGYTWTIYSLARSDHATHLREAAMAAVAVDRQLQEKYGELAALTPDEKILARRKR